ncbi:MAG: hypothetical protein NZ954_03425 [Thermofilaceae archaeon]|nr:hypothetical protein [Thermofilaceae archaeon]MDW8004889.1 hypothetical protein [Thermofilaceae archaeon]
MTKMELDHPLEKLFRGSRKTLRVLRVLALAHKPMSKYSIEAQAAVYDTEKLLAHLVDIGVVKVIDGHIKRYTLNQENSVVNAVLRLMKDVGYLE